MLLTIVLLRIQRSRLVRRRHERLHARRGRLGLSHESRILHWLALHAIIPYDTRCARVVHVQLLTAAPLDDMRA